MKDPAGITGGMNLYQYCNSNPTSYVDVTGGRADYINYSASAYCGGCFPAIPNDRPLIIPGPGVEGRLVGTLIEVFPYIVVGVETYIEIFPAMERDFFQNVICTKSKTNFDYKKSVSGKSGKEAAKDVPSWAKGERPYRGSVEMILQSGF